MNTQYAMKMFKHIPIEQCKMDINGIGQRSINKKIHLYFADPDNNYIIQSEEVF